MIPYKSPFATAVPNTLEKRMEIANAIRALASEESEQLRQRRADIAALRRDLELLRRSFPGLIAQAIAEVRRDCDPRLRSYVLKYSPDQPRVPAGNPDGGQWTNEDAAGYSGYPIPNDGEPDAAQKPVEYAAVETETRTDATDAPPGIQYAAASEDDEGESRAGGLFEGTPAQLLRQGIAVREYRAALSQVLRYDPTWKPRPTLIDPNDIEGDIARLEAWTKEANEYLGRLRNFAKPLDRYTGNPISSSTEKTGDPSVDSTTEMLNNILDRVVARIGPRSGRTAGQYGREVHDEFKREVSASRLPGIDNEDLDKTFGLSEGASYGEKDSVRPDVVLRDDQGNIVAMYDVKTGRGFSTFKVIKYRLRTGSDSFIPIFELHPHGRTIWKARLLSCLAFGGHASGSS